MDILVCDDNEDLLEVLSLILEEKYSVYTAKNGLEGVAKYVQHRPKIVLMDLKMPEMDGIEASKRIFDIDPDVCIIGFTAYASVKADEFYSSGVRGIIEKPVRMNELIQKIQNICDIATGT